MFRNSTKVVNKAAESVAVVNSTASQNLKN